MLKKTGFTILLLVTLGFVWFTFLSDFGVGKRSSSTHSKSDPRGDVNSSYYTRCSECNLIIISATNTRADHLPTYGYKRNTMPNVESLAQNGAVLDNVFAHSSWTLPSGISIQTSMYPTDHKVMMRVPVGMQLPADTTEERALPSIAHLPGLPDILQRNGYNTFASHGGFDYDQFYGLTSRFDSQVAHGPSNNSIYEYGSLASSIPTAINWLEQHHNEKFFMFIQGFDAHCPFGVPTINREFTDGLQSSLNFSRCYWTFDVAEPVINNGVEQFPVMTEFIPEIGGPDSVLLSREDIEYMKALYDGELAIIDRMIGQFLSRLRQLNLESKTIVVFLSEHGDMFGKHGRFMRGGPLRGTFYDDVLHIPVVIKNPKDPLIGRRISQLLESVDIAPSLLDMLNIKAPSTFRGKSVIPLLEDPNREGRPYVQAAGIYSASADNLFFNRSSKLSAVRTARYKVIQESIWPIDQGPFNSLKPKPLPSTPPETERFELYDLSVDPEELHNIFDRESQIARELLNKAAPMMTPQPLPTNHP